MLDRRISLGWHLLVVSGILVGEMLAEGRVAIRGTNLAQSAFLLTTIWLFMVKSIRMMIILVLLVGMISFLIVGWKYNVFIFFVILVVKDIIDAVLVVVVRVILLADGDSWARLLENHHLVRSAQINGREILLLFLYLRRPIDIWMVSIKLSSCFSWVCYNMIYLCGHLLVFFQEVRVVIRTAALIFMIRATKFLPIFFIEKRNWRIEQHERWNQLVCCLSLL